MMSTLATLLLYAHFALAGDAWGPGGGFGGFGGPKGGPGGPGGWGGMPPWGDNDWNWGMWGGPKGGPPGAPAPPPGAPPPQAPDVCPPGAPPPGFVAPFQPLFNQHYTDSPPGDHWQQMCPRDKARGDLYIPVSCAQERKGCCTWRATATKLVNGVWACCPCGASCTGAAPGFGYEWTENAPVPTPVGWTAVGGGAPFPFPTPNGPPVPITTTFLANGGTSISTIYPGNPAPTPSPGFFPFSVPGAQPTVFTTTINGATQTYTSFYQAQPTPFPVCPPGQPCTYSGTACIPGQPCPFATQCNGVACPAAPSPTSPITGSWTWTSATTSNGKSIGGSWVHITGTKTTPVSACNVKDGKTSCHVLSTTSVGCSPRGTTSVCSTSQGPQMQTVNAAPTNAAGVAVGVLAGAVVFAYGMV